MASYQAGATDQLKQSGALIVDGGKKYLQANHLAKMKDWVGDGPLTFRAAALLGGVLMVISGFLGLFGVLFNPLHGVIEGYMCLFGMLIVMLEAKNMVCKEQWSAIIYKQAKFLTLLAGRGYFYIFVGTLLMSQWPDVMDTVLGIYMSVVGATMVAVGHHANGKLKKMKGHVKDEEAVKAAFAQADVDNSGALNATELAMLCKTLGSDLDHNELEAALCSLDSNDNGVIEYEEFLSWWKST